MPTPEELEEQKRAEEKKLADQKQLDARNELAKDVGAKPDANPSFGPMEMLRNEFVDKNSGSPDWIKIAVAGLGGIALGTFGADFGIGGIIAMAVAGTAIAGLAAHFLVPMLRHDDPNEIPRGQAVRRPDAPEANEKIIENAPVTLPAVAPVNLGESKIDVPFYNVEQNPAAKATRENIEKLRATVADGNPYTNGDPASAANSQARAFLDEVEKSANSNEINLRYLRDNMPKGAQEASDKVDAYLSKLSPEAAKALSIKLNMDLKDVPGQYANLPQGLEEYGTLIKDKLLKEMAARHGGIMPDVESAKTIQTAWNGLNVVAKRNLIDNFAKSAIEETLNKPTEIREFFPEHEKDLYGIKINTNLNPNSLQNQFISAKENHDLKKMSEVLEQRLADDKDMTGGSKLSDPIKERMQMFITGFHAGEKKKELDAYIKNTVEPDLEKLHKFEDALKDRNGRVTKLQSSMQAFAQSGGKYLVLEQSAPANDHQTIKVLDAHGAQPKNISIDITFEKGSTDKIKSLTVDGVDKTAVLNNKTLPADDAGRVKILQEAIESTATAAMPQKVMNQVADVRGTANFIYASNVTPPTASNAPLVLKTKDKANPIGKKTEQRSTP